MASDDPKPRRKVPPPKTHYPLPEQEPQSPDTQAAADRWLSGWPDIDPDKHAPKEGGK